jgi:phosphoglycerate dehydrogenase-like enzyme
MIKPTLTSPRRLSRPGKRTVKAGRQRLKGLYVLDRDTFGLIYGPDERRAVAELVDIYAPPQTAESVAQNPALLAEADVILSGWGAPRMDDAFLDGAPKLQAVFYGAGSIRPFATDAIWKRGVIVTSAAVANAQPVAEYTLAAILLSLKHFWRYAAAARNGDGWGDHKRPVPGSFRATVGLISLGTVARRVLELLEPFDVQRLVYDPFLTDEQAGELDVERCSLEDVFRRADVVSLHAPELRETRGMIAGRHFAAMKPGATFINTARGAIVRETEMVEALRRRPDVTAVLDVTDPEPPVRGSALLTLPNVVLTPHIAGSMGSEIRRLGHCMVEELRRYVNGEPLRWQITREIAARLA